MILDPVAHVAGPPSEDHPGAYPRREMALALLNLGVLATLFLVHVAFITLLGPPSGLLLTVLSSVFALQIGSLAWLQSLRVLPSARARRAHAFASIGGMLIAAFLAALYGEGAEHHYFVLMVPAIISTGFRFGFVATGAVVAVAIGLTFYDVWRWFHLHPPAELNEYFEAASVSLMFLVMGGVVAVLAGLWRRDQQRLHASVSELARTRDRLIAEEKLAAVGRLSGAIAHEIRNPVAMISSSLAAAREGPEAKRSSMFAIATEEAARLERLTSEFLEYARARPPRREPTDVAAAVGYVAELARARAAEHGVTITCFVDPGAVAPLDAFQVHQALLNLVANAIAATPCGGMVTLCARIRGGELTIGIDNPGGPLPADTVRNLFEPFFTTRPGGTGLGLPIARSIARAHGGDVALVQNDATRIRFELTVPASAPAEESCPTS